MKKNEVVLSAVFIPLLVLSAFEANLTAGQESRPA
jgi:hypothetical protein